MGTFALSLTAAHAAPIGGIISYQGSLSDSAGKPIADGSTSMTFKIYEDGNEVLSQTMSVATIGGVFNTFLSVGTLTFDPGKSYELGIQSGTSAEVRHPIAAVPVALASASTGKFTGALEGDVTGTQGATVVSQVGGQTAADVANTTVEVKAATPNNMADALVKRASNGGVKLGSIESDGSLLATAVLKGYDTGELTAVPTEGAGARLMWHGDKAAFRAGEVNGTQWDDPNIGYFSAAVGRNTRALGDGSFASGQDTVAANTNSTAMGEGSRATGYASVALGYYAHTNARRGSFVFSDDSIPADFFYARDARTFNVRASGGYRLFSNSNLTTGFTFKSEEASLMTTTNALKLNSDGSTEVWSNGNGSAGVSLYPGSGSWTSLSDRNTKDNIAAVNPREVLRGVLKLPISTWNYKTQPKYRHMGPMAQDFHAAFGVGESDKTIATIDPDGVAFAAIQGLNAELRDRDAKIAAQDAKIAAQNAKNAALEARLQKLERAFANR